MLFTPTRSDGRYHSNACRQRAHRARLARNLAAPEPFRLTPELRGWLRREIDRRRRELVATGADQVSQADYALFAADRAMFPRGAA
jgi:hypothetical protein